MNVNLLSIVLIISFYLYCHFTGGGVIIIRSDTIAMDQDGLPPGFEDTDWTPPHSASNGSAQEAATTLTEIPVDLTSEPAVSTRPGDAEEVKGTGSSIISESPSLVITGTQVPVESEEVYGKDIAEDTVEVATEVGDSVTLNPFDGIVAEVGEDKIVPDTTEEEAVVEDDKFLEIIPEDVDAPYSEVIQEVTPQGEEPPSEVVAEDLFTEATAVVLAKPTISATEAATLGELGQEVTLKPAAEAESEAVMEHIQETTVEGIVGPEVEEIPDKSLDISPDVEVTDKIGEEHTKITEAVPDAPELAEVAVLGESEGDIKNPPAEHPSEADLEVSQDEIKVGTDASPTVLLVTNQDSEEEAEIFINVTPEQESVLAVEIELTSQASILTTTDRIAVEVSNDIDMGKVPEDKPTLVAEITSEPFEVILQDDRDEDISYVTEETPPNTTVGEIEATDEDTPEEKEILVEATEKPEEEVKTEVKHEEASVVIEDEMTKAAVEVESTEVITAKTDVKKQTETVVAETAEELPVETEDVTVAEEEMVKTAEEKLPKETEEATFMVEDAEEASVHVTTEPVEAVIETTIIEEGPVKTVDETTKEREERIEVPGEPIEGGDKRPEAPIEPVEKEGADATETVQEAETTVKAIQEPVPVEESVEIVEPTVGDAKEAELVKETAKVTESTTEPTQESKLGEESIKPLEAPAQVEPLGETAKEIEPKGEPSQEVEPVGETTDETEHIGVPAQEVEPEEDTAEETELTVEPAKEAEHKEKNAEELAEPTGEPVQEAEIVEEIPKKTEPTREPPQEAEVIKEVAKEKAPTGGSPQEPEVVANEDKSDLAIISLDKTQEATREEPLEDREEATFEEIMEEDSGVAEPKGEGFQPDVSEEVVSETFDEISPESDEVITPLIVVVPEDTEGLLPETKVEETPEPEVKVELPGDSEVEAQPETTKSTSQVVEPTSEVIDSESLHEVEKEIVPEDPSVITPEVVTHPGTTTVGETIEPEEVTQELPDEPVLKGSPEEDVIPIEDSVQVVPKEVEVISTGVSAEDAEEIMTEAPVEVTSESLDKIIPETVVEVTSENVQSTTVDAMEEPTPTISLDKYKYVVEYNNGNFPDITESPYSVDDNLLGNKGFGMEEEDENLVST